MNDWEHAEEARYQAMAEHDRWDGWDRGDLDYREEEERFIGPLQQFTPPPSNDDIPF